jgi:hypothetical protein
MQLAKNQKILLNVKNLLQKNAMFLRKISILTKNIYKKIKLKFALALTIVIALFSYVMTKSIFIVFWMFPTFGLMFQHLTSNFFSNENSILLVAATYFALFLLYLSNIILAQLFAITLIPKQITRIDGWINQLVGEQSIFKKIIYQFVIYSPLIFLVSSILKSIVWGGFFFDAWAHPEIAMYMLPGGKTVMGSVRDISSRGSKIQLRFNSVFLDTNRQKFATICALNLNKLLGSAFDPNFIELKSLFSQVPIYLDKIFELPFDRSRLPLVKGGRELLASLNFSSSVLEAKKSTQFELDLAMRAQDMAFDLEADEFGETLNLVSSQKVWSKLRQDRIINDEFKKLLFHPSVLFFNKNSITTIDATTVCLKGLGIENILLKYFIAQLKADGFNPVLISGLFHMWCTSEGRIVQNLLQMLDAYLIARNHCGQQQAQLLFISALPTQFTGASQSSSDFYKSVGDFIFMYKLKNSVEVCTEIIEIKHTPSYIDLEKFNRQAAENISVGRSAFKKLDSMRSYPQKLQEFLALKHDAHKMVIVQPDNELAIPYPYSVEEGVTVHRSLPLYCKN